MVIVDLRYASGTLINFHSAHVQAQCPDLSLVRRIAHQTLRNHHEANTDD